MEKLSVRLSDHAILDCIPLRYGIVLPKKHGKFEGVFDKKGTDNQKPKEIKAGRKHYVGTLICCDDNVISDVRVVLDTVQEYRKAQTVISVLSKDVALATRGVSDLISGLRKEKKITPKHIAGVIYPLYNSKKIKTEVELFEELVKLGIQEKTDNYRIHLDEANRHAENNNQMPEIELANLREEIKQSETKSPGYSGETIEVAPVCTLKSVTVGSRINSRKQNIKCTEFEFHEDVPIRIMDAWADPDGSKTEKAESLIDKQVMTTTWRPEKYDPLKWCRNIYQA